MSDDDKKKDDSGTGGTPTSKSVHIKPDPSKSNEDYIKEAEKYYIVPKLVRETFPDLIKLVFETESMDEDEREYWLQILPIMSEEQIKKFRDILVNEKDQLKKLDTEYQSDMANLDKKYGKEFDEKEVKQKREDLRAQEAEAEEKEKGAEDALLDQLDNL